MKILHIISQHPESTGSGFYLQNIIRQAADAGYQNYLIAGISGNQPPQIDGVKKEHFSSVSFGEGGLNFDIPGMSDVMPYSSSRFSDLTTSQLQIYEKTFTENIRRAVQAFSPDIIHSHHLWLVSAFTRKLIADIPIVTSCHSTDLRQFLQCPHLREKVLPRCKKIDRVLALSHGQAEKIQHLYGIDGNLIDIAGGGYDQNLFTMGKKEQPPHVHLLYAGKLSFAKGVDWLLHSASDLKPLGIHLHLAGSGSGDEARLCRELAVKSDVPVTVHGRLNQQQLANLMRRCHIFILPSFYEGLPLVLLEALASGCRIITTDLPGCRELLDSASPDLVQFIKLPAMQKIDRPNPEDWGTLRTRLKAAITVMTERAKTSPTPDAKDIHKITSSAAWKEVFDKVALSYRKAIQTKRRMIKER